VILLDTHIALWTATNDPLLPALAKTYLLAPDAEVFVSAASIWEISIKHALGPGQPHPMLISGAQAIVDFEASGFELLPILPGHAAHAGALPRHHADPFDRMIVAQAMLDGLVLITHNRRLAAYHPGVIVV
jgi:PIN domain nuclease of toxin-antitoxin system